MGSLISRLEKLEAVNHIEVEPMPEECVRMFDPSPEQEH
jgi:hypothetical protein